MADVVDPQTRSRMMRGIRGKDTKPEMALRKALHGKGLRYRLHAHDLPGKPDIIFRKYGAVVLVHGCFWHRHADCRYATIPKTHTKFWKNKFAANVARDEQVGAQLTDLDWRIAIVWECALRNSALTNVAADQVAAWLHSSEDLLELGNNLI